MSNEYIMNIISVKDRLPENNTYVLIHLKKTKWHDKDDDEGAIYWTVAKFVRGISKEERKIMTDEYRKSIYSSCDEDGNNKKPYCWLEFGPGEYFGQDVDYWAYLPDISSESIKRAKKEKTRSNIA